MKKFLSMALIVCMLLSFAGCKGEDVNKGSVDVQNASTSTETTVSTTIDNDVEMNVSSGTVQDDTVGSTTNTTTTDISNDLPTSANTTTSAQISDVNSNTNHQHKYSHDGKDASCEKNVVRTYTCVCGDKYTENIPAKGHKWGDWKTITPATSTKDGKAERSCKNCLVKETKVLPKNGSTTTTTTNKPTTSTTKPSEESYSIEYEPIEVIRPNAYYIGDVDMLSYMFGTNKAFQKGDTIKYKITERGGKAVDYYVWAADNCSCTVENDVITVYITGNSTRAQHGYCYIVFTDADGREAYFSADYDYIVKDDSYLPSNNQQMEYLFNQYGDRVVGIKWVSNLHFLEGYSLQGDGNIRHSLTNNFGKEGVEDDYFDKDKPEEWLIETEDWIVYTIWIINQYKNMGLTRFGCGVGNQGVGFRAAY